jgi:hypothetical protein
MKFFWSSLSYIYTQLYFSGLKIKPPKILFNKPKNKLLCEYVGTIYADNSFTNEERILILEALDDLNYFCNGIIVINIEFTLDNTDEEFIKTHNTILKVTKDHPDIKESDNKIKAQTLGLYCYMQNSIGKIYLVCDRLGTSLTLRTTATHELGHFIGLEHTPHPSIMHKHNFNDVLFPTYLDAKDMSIAWKINPEMLRYFKL